MATVTKLPTSDIFSTNSAVNPSGTAYAALTDTSDSTNVELSTIAGPGYVVMGLADITLAAREHIMAVRVALRAECAPFGPQTEFVACDLTVALKAPSAAGDYFQTQLGHFGALPYTLSGTPTTDANVYTPWATQCVGPNGNQEWSQALFNAEQLVLYEGGWIGAGQTVVMKAWVEVLTNHEPQATVLTVGA